MPRKFIRVTEQKSKHPNFAMTRRSLLASFLALPLASCRDGEAVSVRFRVIAKVWVDAIPYQASTVMQVNYTRIKGSLTGTGGATRLYGEALIFDLPQGRGTFFVLPYLRSPSGSLREFFPEAILKTFGIDRGVGSLKNEDLEVLKSAKGLKALNFYGRYPTMVGFTDPTRPNSIFEITPDRLSAIFPNVNLVGFDIEITTDPVTDRLRQRLPWLNQPNNAKIFDRPPPGDRRPARELPIVNVITQSNFFGNGSR